MTSYPLNINNIFQFRNSFYFHFQLSLLSIPHPAFANIEIKQDVLSAVCCAVFKNAESRKISAGLNFNLCLNLMNIEPKIVQDDHDGHHVW